MLLIGSNSMNFARRGYININRIPTEGYCGSLSLELMEHAVASADVALRGSASITL